MQEYIKKIEELEYIMKCQKGRDIIDTNNKCEKAFHYTDIVALESILKNKKLWLTRFDFLNDKTEFRYIESLINEVFKKNDFKVKECENHSFYMDRIKKLLKDSFIFSMSLNNDSMNLWGNYSKMDGYNIELDPNKISQAIENKKFYLSGNEDLKKYYDITEDIVFYKQCGKVIDSEEKQKIILIDILKPLDSLYKEFYKYISCCDSFKKVFEETERVLYDRILHNTVLFKSPYFSQEEEYRIVLTLNPDDKSDRNVNMVKYRIKDGIFVPYIEGVFEDNTFPIKGITVGPKKHIDADYKLSLKGFITSLGYKAKIENKKNIIDENYSDVIIRDSKIPLR